MNHGTDGPVLVVHGDEGIRDLITGALALDGVTAQSAAPDEAVGALTRLRPGLVLLDLDDGGGGAAVRAALGRRRDGSVPIVGLTTRPRGAHGPPMRAAAVLRMPFDLDDLVGTVGLFCAAD